MTLSTKTSTESLRRYPGGVPTSAVSSTSLAPAGGLRSRARRAMQAEVAAVAMELFLKQGFDGTTVDHIAAAAGMSRSSFFRYFPTKEDVVLVNVADHGQQILDVLAARPDDEPIWTAVRAAFEPVVADRPNEEHDRSLRLARMFMETPSLQARHYEKTLAWQTLLVPEIARRMGVADPAGDPRPAALIAGAVACFDTALRFWSTADGRTPLSDLFDRALSAVASD